MKKIIKINELEEDLRIEAVKRWMKEKPVNFKENNRIRDRDKSRNSNSNGRIKNRNIKRSNEEKS